MDEIAEELKDIDSSDRLEYITLPLQKFTIDKKGWQTDV